MKPLVYFSPVSWYSFPQRSHEMVNWIHSETGKSVLWVEPSLIRYPRLSDLPSIGQHYKRLNKNLPDWLTVVNPPWMGQDSLAAFFLASPVYRKRWHSNLARLGAGGEVIVGLPSMLALEYVQFIRCESRSIGLDLMDNFPAFHSRAPQVSTRIFETIEELVQLTDYAMFSSDALKEKYSKEEDKSEVVLNAHNCESLPLERTARFPRPLLGYVGTIGSWFDWEAVEMIANSTQEKLIIAGPIYSRPKRKMPLNVELLGPVSHIEAGELISKISLALIPFRINEITDFVDPIKYYEYAHFGLPVMTSEFGQMKRRAKQDLVYAYDSYESLLLCLEGIESIFIKSGERISGQSCDVPNWQGRLSFSKILSRMSY